MALALDKGKVHELLPAPEKPQQISKKRQRLTPQKLELATMAESMIAMAKKATGCVQREGLCISGAG